MTIVRMGRQAAIMVCTLAVLVPGEALAQSRACKPVAERTAEIGCWIVASAPQGNLQANVYWHLYTYTSRADAESAKEARDTVIEALGKVWLFSIGLADRRPGSGTHVASIGPLALKTDRKYTAQYMEAVWAPGTASRVHRHPGPEAWYTMSGEICLETPDGKIVAGAGQATLVPEGPPMQLTATGNDMRRSVVLILHDASQPDTHPAVDWKPKGLCKA